MAKKLTTAEILAQARKQKAAGDAGDESASAPPDQPVAEQPNAEPADETPAAPAPAKKAPAAGGGTPKSTADILAAARAQKTGGASAEKPAAAPAAEGKPAVKPTPKSTADILAAARGKGGAAPAKAGAAKPAKAAPTGAPTASGEALPSVEEMMKAVRGQTATAVAEPPAKPKPTLPPLPKKPVAAKKAPEPVSRRGVLMSLIGTPFAAAWTFIAATTATATLGVARFMFPNVLVEPPTRFKVGPPGDYPLGTVSDKWKSSRGIWIVHTDQYDGRNLIYALASVCTHLGCTPSWLDGEQKFKCPCHGSGFYITGINFEGPAPRPLERVGLRVAPDGMLEVDKSVKFQEEMGQWGDQTSFVEMV